MRLKLTDGRPVLPDEVTLGPHAYCAPDGRLFIDLLEHGQRIDILDLGPCHCRCLASPDVARVLSDGLEAMANLAALLKDSPDKVATLGPALAYMARLNQALVDWELTQRPASSSAESHERCPHLRSKPSGGLPPNG